MASEPVFCRSRQNEETRLSAACAVVNCNVSPYAIIGGAPARVIGHRKQDNDQRPEKQI